MPHNYWIACGQTSAQLWERYNLQSSWRADKLGKYEETTMMTTTIKSRLANIENFFQNEIQYFLVKLFWVIL